MKKDEELRQKAYEPGENETVKHWCWRISHKEGLTRGRIQSLGKHYFGKRISRSIITRALSDPDEPKFGRRITARIKRPRIVEAKKATALWDKGDKLYSVSTQFALPNLQFYNRLKAGGYAKDWDEFVNECILFSLSKHPDIVVEADPEVLKLRTQIRRDELQDVLKGKKVDIEKEIYNALRYKIMGEIISDLKEG